MEVFLQNVIAVIWDFDKTLTPRYMQEPLFKEYGVDANKFWQEVDGLVEFYRAQGVNRVNRDTIYLNHILTYVRKGIFKGLSNKKLRELGAKIEFFPGLPEFFQKVKEFVEEHPLFREHDIKLEHYIVSTGIYEMIKGSKIAPYVDDIWACEFVEEVAEPGYLEKKKQQTLFGETHITGARVEKEIKDICYAIDNTTKTRAIFEINKGSNKVKSIGVNDNIKPEHRRVPFENMIYIADGPSDIPVFSIMKQYGGVAFAVYEKGNRKAFKQVNELQRQGRIHAFGEADYRENSQIYMLIMHYVEEIAHRIVKKQYETLKKRVGKPPRHI